MEKFLIWLSSICEDMVFFKICTEGKPVIMKNLLAFDLGASNGRAILGQLENGKLTMRELHRFENNFIEMNGVYYWDLPYLFNQLKLGLLAFKQANVGDLDCFGIDTWGVDYGLLDKNGHLLGNPRAYRYSVDEDFQEAWKVVDFPTLFARTGIELHYVNTRMENATEYLRSLTGGTGYDDVICFAPVKPVIEQADDILGFDGCLNFFAGPTDSQFKAPFNWYNVHYLYTHVVGTSGGNTNDMQEAIEMMNAGKLNPSALVTHIGGLNAVIDTTLNLPKIPGGKKLIYNHIDLPLTAIADFEEKGKTDPMFAELDRMCKANNNLWNPEAEKYLLANAPKI